MHDAGMLEHRRRVSTSIHILRFLHATGHNTRRFDCSLALFLALLLLVKLLNEHRPNRPTFLSVLCNRARLEFGAARGRARVPFANVVFINNVCLIQCGENLTEERRAVR
jgi:hypothetical protein